jgi:CRP-like cAMP-binding protein
MALVAQAPRRSATVAALEDAETFAVYREEFDALCRRHPQVSAILMQFLTTEVRMLNERLLEALYLPVERRVVRRLVELAAVYPSANGEIVIPLTQEVIAELAGARRATVNQVLQDEQRRGTISLERGRTRILDLEELRRRA